MRTAPFPRETNSQCSTLAQRGISASRVGKFSRVDGLFLAAGTASALHKRRAGQVQFEPFAEIEAHRGTQFDTTVVDALFAIFGRQLSMPVVA